MISRGTALALSVICLNPVQTAEAEEGFIRDIDQSSIIGMFSLPTFGDLDLSESAHADADDFCWHDEALYLISATEFGGQTPQSKAFMVTRQSDKSVTVETDPASLSGSGDIPKLIGKLARASLCTEVLA